MPPTRRTFLTKVGVTAGAGAVATGTAGAQQGTTVEMVTEGNEYYFDPIGLHVEPGTTVTFEIRSGSHSATAYRNRIPENATAWDSGILSTQGAIWEYTFEAKGTHDYYCIPHKSLGMVGRIVVGEPGGPAEGSMPPDGDVPDSRTIVDQGSISYEAFTSGGTGDGPWKLGAGLLGGMAALAGVVYWVVNSEGERYRVGSAAWKRRHELE